ncbi:hypothetical protein OG746_24060 [Streptomyces sp. NBC_01016]|uniref:hypothetical protein n=1 Tax=Streptomyces sp. NBC_01016 TaxID=2903720 RepID=UPI0022591871|nr:hypothetical protein [Streptomyces sp. NBC_01016]MCX4831819.1 hypothetical protein [Streptomyces sp. NBC_01016]
MSLLATAPDEVLNEPVRPGEVVGAGESAGVTEDEIAARFREEIGEVIDGISEDELLLIAKIFRNNTEMRRRHELGVFDGDLLLVVAEDGGENATPDERLRLWEPYVRGSIAAVGLPCRHTNLMLPEMLSRAWQAIAEWMETRRTEPGA